MPQIVPAQTGRLPRRLVLLADGEESAVQEVLQEYRDGEVRGSRIHDALRRQAQIHGGRYIAAEWLGPLGWTRYLWCRKGTI